MVSFDEFKKLNLIVAKILEVNNHPNADKLYVLTVDTGSGIKTIVAGIREFYIPEQLVGKLIVLLENLEPATLRGVQSDAMLLATRDKVSGKLSLIIPENSVEIGSSIS